MATSAVNDDAAGAAALKMREAGQSEEAISNFLERGSA